MKFSATLGLVLMLLATHVFPQQKPAAAAYKPFVGTWTSQIQGKTFLTLKLSLDGDALKGTMTGASVHFDRQGNLTSAEPRDATHDIIDTTLNGDILSFKTKEEDHEPVGFEMKLDDANNGELTLKIPHPQEGAPVPKPWKIVRESDKAQDPK